MVYVKKYVQFNDLVIDNYEMLQGADLSGGFKAQAIEYGFANGSYAPFKSRQQYARAQSLSMTLKFDTRKLESRQKGRYRDFISLNIASPGRLWAVQGEQIVWAWAYVSDYSEVYEFEKLTFSMDISMELYEGVWHKADPRKTFLKPYDPCMAINEYDFRDFTDCLDCCTSCAAVNRECPPCIAECEFLEEEYSLCSLSREAPEELCRRCGGGYKIIYNCEAGKKIWGEAKMLGHKICKKETCREIVAGKFYSDTILDSGNVAITISGAVKDPSVTVNGNTARIQGEYAGMLTLYPNGDIYYLGDKCCGGRFLAPDMLEIPEGSTFGFVARHGNNSVLVETHNCCSMVCVYIYVDRITI